MDIRRLDFDDLFLLQQLLEGKTLTAVAETLNISQPAISQRIRKISDIFKCQLVQQRGRRVELSSEGLALASKATAALRLMQNQSPSAKEQVINIGTRLEPGVSWLGEAVFDLRKSHPRLCFHLHFASGTEILQRLGGGQLDAVLTSAPITVRDFRSIELVDEKYAFVARAEIAKTIRKPEDLQSHVLVEFDRSFPFLRYLAAETRARLTFGDVWFMGSTELMAQAIKRGYAVGIVPHYLVKKDLDSGTLQTLPFSRHLSHDSFRFILRSDPQLEENLGLLAARLRKIGLR